MTLYYRSCDRGPNGQPAFVIERTSDGQWFRWTWCDGIAFHIHATQREVFVQWPPSEGPDSCVYYFLGPVLAFILRQRGVSLLHGSVVCSSGSAIAFLGDSGAGKSTIAAALLDRGYAALTDDLIALARLDGELCVWPGYAGLRLWADSVERLFRDAATMPRLVANSGLWPGWDKRILSLNDGMGRFCERPVPLRRLYVIGDRVTGAPTIASLSMPRRMMELDRNAYQRYLRNDSTVRSDFAVFADLIQQAPIQLLNPSDGLAEIGRLTSRIHFDIRSG